MATRLTIRRMSALTLVVTVSVIGIPLPTHAAGEESPPRVLTVHGQPLSHLLATTRRPDSGYLSRGRLRTGCQRPMGQLRSPFGIKLGGNNVRHSGE